MKPFSLDPNMADADEAFENAPESKPTSSSRRSCIPRMILYLALLALFVWYYWDTTQVRLPVSSNDENLYNRLKGMDLSNSCESTSSSVVGSSVSVPCLCPNPSVPLPRGEDDGYNRWINHHHTMLEQAILYEELEPLDVLLLGDSITEQLNGTRGMGAKPTPMLRMIFQNHFNRTSLTHVPNAVNGLAFGSSGDTTMELLWHLQNGILDDQASVRLNPSVIMVLIGTNDIGRFDCSKEAVVVGIETVVDYIRKQRPQSKILLHGLLPRSDNYGADPVDYTLGKKWETVKWINQHLKQYCSVKVKDKDTCDYFEANELFLEGQEGPLNPVRISPDMMTDALHPSALGYKNWESLIVDKVQEMIQEH